LKARKKCELPRWGQELWVHQIECQPSGSSLKLSKAGAEKEAFFSAVFQVRIDETGSKNWSVE
jgi:hypothetical protein